MLQVFSVKGFGLCHQTLSLKNFRDVRLLIVLKYLRCAAQVSMQDSLYNVQFTTFRGWRAAATSQRETKRYEAMQCSRYVFHCCEGCRLKTRLK